MFKMQASEAGHRCTGHHSAAYTFTHTVTKADAETNGNAQSYDRAKRDGSRHPVAHCDEADNDNREHLENRLLGDVDHRRSVYIPRAAQVQGQAGGSEASRRGVRAEEKGRRREAI